MGAVDHECKLDTVRVVRPCPVSWDEMQGSDTVRHCLNCALNVYNLSEMTREEAETFLAKNEGRRCIRLYRREDGTVITRDCGQVRRRPIPVLVATLVGLALLFLLQGVTGLWNGFQPGGKLVTRQHLEKVRRSSLYQHTKVQTTVEWVDATLFPPPPPRRYDYSSSVMGIEG